jgi:hypothetical protein
MVWPWTSSRHAARHPDHPAIVDGDTVVSWQAFLLFGRRPPSYVAFDVLMIDGPPNAGTRDPDPSVGVLAFLAGFSESRGLGERLLGSATCCNRLLNGRVRMLELALLSAAEMNPLSLKPTDHSAANHSEQVGTLSEEVLVENEPVCGCRVLDIFCLKPRTPLSQNCLSGFLLRHS